MRQILSPTISNRAAGCRRLVLWLLAALAAPGCRHGPHIEFISTTKPTTVQLIQPKFRNIVRVVGQPSFIESYERTSIYPKPTAYIQKWIVDIGDRVKKNDVLATLFARAGRAARDEEGGRCPRPRAYRAGQRGGGRGQCQRRGGRGARRSGRGDPLQIPGRGRSLGHGGQSAPAPGLPGRGQRPSAFRVDQSAHVKHRSAGQGEGDHQEGEGRTARRGPGSKRPKWTSGSPKLP